MINEGLSEIIGPFPVPSPRDKRERNDDPGQKRRGHRYSVHPSNHTISIDYRDRRSVNYLDHSQFCWPSAGPMCGGTSSGWARAGRKLKTWALEWLRRIRVLYRLNDRRLAAEKGSAAFAEADGCLRQAVAEMKTQMETELARADLATPCRKVLESLQEHWEGLTRFVDDPRIPMDNNASERRAAGPGGGAEELLRLGIPMERSTGGGVVLDLCHVVDVEAQSSEMADVVLRAMRGGRGQGPGGHPAVLALEPERREEEGTEGIWPRSRGRHFLDRQTEASQRPHFNHDQEEDPVPPLVVLHIFFGSPRPKDEPG